MERHAKVHLYLPRTQSLLANQHTPTGYLKDFLVRVEEGDEAADRWDCHEATIAGLGNQTRNRRVFVERRVRSGPFVIGRALFVVHDSHFLVPGIGLLRQFTEEAFNALQAFGVRFPSLTAPKDRSP